MHVRDVMNATANVVTPEMSLTDVARKMEQDGVGFLPVGENDRLKGTITDRDIVLRAISQGKDPQSTSIGEILTDELIYCSEDQDVTEVARTMGDKQIRRLPVINADKRLVGVVSIGDVAQYLDQDTVGKVLASITS